MFDLEVVLSVMNSEVNFEAAETIQGETIGFVQSIEDLGDILK